MKRVIIYTLAIATVFTVGLFAGDSFELRSAVAKGSGVTLHFEEVDKEGPVKGKIYRARVAGGWLVIVNYQGTYVPDPSNQWR